MLSKKLLFEFSRYSSRPTVPRILASSRFTRKGFKILGTTDPASKHYVERRKSRIIRPTDLSNVPNAHLYYDHSKAIKEYELRMESRK